jgi:hypothetical protein
MPPVILKPDNFIAINKIINVSSYEELLQETIQVYGIQTPQLIVEFWLSPPGVTNRKYLSNKTPMKFPLYDILTVYVKVATNHLC